MRASQNQETIIGQNRQGVGFRLHRSIPHFPIALDGVGAENEPWLFDPNPFLIRDSVIASAPAPIDTQKARPTKKDRR